MKGLKGQEGLSSFAVVPNHSDAYMLYMCYIDGDMVGFCNRVTRCFTPQKWHAYVYINLLDRIEEEFDNVDDAMEWIESVAVAAKLLEK